MDTIAKEESDDTSNIEESKDAKDTKESKGSIFDRKSKRIEELEKQLEVANQKAGENLETAQRSQAELANYRRRVDAERADMRKYATLDLVKQLLNTADDLGRALEHAEADNPLTVGVKAIRDNFAKILESQGVKEIPTDGKFDPNLHEALTVIEGDEDDKIAMVAQKGYTMYGKVIRYAKVVVTKKKEEPAAPAPEEGPEEEKENNQ